MSDKILIALQFWEGDREQARKLVDFISDLEPGHSTQADFLLVNRWDCAPITDLIPRLSRKFNVRTYKSRARVSGWPMGCNGLWSATMEYFSSMIQAKRIPGYKAIFTCEADGGPVAKDWIAKLSRAWDRENTGKRVYVAGPMVGSDNGPIHTHINGNAMISSDRKFLTGLMREIGNVPATVGWDYAMADSFKRSGWANLPEIRSIYNTPEFHGPEYLSLQEAGVAWVHGDKSSSLVKLGRENLL